MARGTHAVVVVVVTMGIGSSFIASRFRLQDNILRCVCVCVCVCVYVCVCVCVGVCVCTTKMCAYK
jgi:uncharacterized membrane protein AbrB (regulator of aidB expression)